MFALELAMFPDRNRRLRNRMHDKYREVHIIGGECSRFLSSGIGEIQRTRCPASQPQQRVPWRWHIFRLLACTCGCACVPRLLAPAAYHDSTPTPTLTVPSRNGDLCGRWDHGSCLPDQRKGAAWLPSAIVSTLMGTRSEDEPPTAQGRKGP